MVERAFPTVRHQGITVEDGEEEDSDTDATKAAVDLGSPLAAAGTGASNGSAAGIPLETLRVAVRSQGQGTPPHLREAWPSQPSSAAAIAAQAGIPFGDDAAPVEDLRPRLHTIDSQPQPVAAATLAARKGKRLSAPAASLGSVVGRVALDEEDSSDSDSASGASRSRWEALTVPLSLVFLDAEGSNTRRIVPLGDISASAGLSLQHLRVAIESTLGVCRPAALRQAGAEGG